MTTQRDALGGMVNIPQWFLWRIEPDADRPGKSRKVPCNYDGTGNLDHLSGAGWMAYDAAVQWATYLNSQIGELYPNKLAYTPGFSFTENCGYWFIDVDGAINAAGGWANPQAEYLYNTLVVQGGCAFEVSSSGKGYHVFGKGTLPQHKKKNTHYGLELYTELRGVALGLTGEMSGNADSTAANEIMASTIIPFYFKYDADAELQFDSLDFNGGPKDDRWRGPKDDDELLRRAMASTSTAAAFGSRATFAQLWENAPELRQFYEGESEKDMALIAQLAFWTGKDPVRIEALMQRSALGRPKWLERRGSLTWLQYSILEQIKKPMNVLIDKELESVHREVLERDAYVMPEARKVTGATFVGIQEQAELFKGCVYVFETKKIFAPMENGDVMFMDQEQFNVRYSGMMFMLDENNEGVTKKAYEAFTQNRALRYPQVRYAEFDPTMPPGAVYDKGLDSYVNTYVAPILHRMEPAAGEIEHYFFDFVSRLLPDPRDQAIILYYMAACVQHQGVKFRWCPVVQGTQGNGKSTLANMLEYAVGESLTHRPRSSDLTQKFNGWLYGKTLMIVDDLKIERRDTLALELLKPLITESRATVEGKGKDAVMRKVCANFFMSMNDKKGIPRETNERRYAIFYCAQQTKEERLASLPAEYFISLYDWLNNQDGFAKISWWLAHVSIPHEFNPATGCQTAPVTSSESEIREVNVDEPTRIIADAIEAGIPGFANGWVSYSKVQPLLKDSGYNVTRPQVKAIITSLGYVPHPMLGVMGLTDNPVPIDGTHGKSRLWIHPTHPMLQEPPVKKGDVVKRYISENSEIGGMFG